MDERSPNGPESRPRTEEEATTAESDRLGRPRFVEATLRRQPGSRASVRVELELRGERYATEASGVGDEVMVLRLSAEAGLQTLEKATGRPGLFELVGVKRIHAFDDTVVLTCLRLVGEPGRRLLGSVPVGRGGSLAEATVLSLLNATNRVVEWLPAHPEPEEP